MSPKPDCPEAAVGHLGHDRNVIVDPHTAGLDLPGGTVGAPHRWSTPDAAKPYGVSLAKRMASSSSSKGQGRPGRARRPLPGRSRILGGVGDQGRGRTNQGTAGWNRHRRSWPRRPPPVHDHGRDLLLLCGADQRADVGGLLRGVAQDDLAHHCGDAVDESFVQAAVHVGAEWPLCSPGRC